MKNKILNLLFRNIPKNLRHNFGINVLVMIFGGLFSGCYTPFYGVIAREQFHADPFWIGLVFASMSITGILGFAAAGMTRTGKEHIRAKYIHIFSSIFLILSAFAVNAPMFCILLFLFHLTACYSPLEGSVYGYIYSLRDRGRMLGYSKTFASVSSMAVTLVAGIFINMKFYGINIWGIIFIFSGIMHILRGVAIGKFTLPSSENREKEAFGTFLKKSFYLIKERHNIILIISGLLLSIGLNIFSTLYPMFQVDVLHINGREVALMSVAGSVAIIFAYPILGGRFSKNNPIKVWLWVYPLALISPLFYIFCGKSWYPLILANILNTAFTVIYDIGWLNLIIYLGGTDRIKDYQAFYGLILGVRAIAGLFVSTWIIRYCEHLAFGTSLNLKTGFLAGVLFTIISMFTAFGLLKAKRRTE